MASQQDRQRLRFLARTWLIYFPELAGWNFHGFLICFTLNQLSVQLTSGSL